MFLFFPGRRLEFKWERYVGIFRDFGGLTVGGLVEYVRRMSHEKRFMMMMRRRRRRRMMWRMLAVVVVGSAAGDEHLTTKRNYFPGPSE